MDLARTYGWDGEIVLREGPRGALGRIWRVEVGAARYALKESDPQPEDLLTQQREFAHCAEVAGINLPASHPDASGRWQVPTPDGRCLRLYDWVDLRPVDLHATATPKQLGTLLARLHQCAPPATGTLDPWYDTVPAREAFPADPRLDARLEDLPELAAMVTPVDPATVIQCHRDLHPENVQCGKDGGLVVLDWDNIGPANPGREVAQALFDWFCDPSPELAKMREMYEAYLNEGGPGRVTALTDFSMLLAARLNFLLRQSKVTSPQEKAWAEREIEEALRILPAPHQLTEVLAAIAG